MEDTRGRGWWGSNDYADYYENLGSGDDPFSYIKVIPLISQEAQHKCGGFDHAGKFETSLLYALYPDHVSLEKTKENTEWFAESAKEASKELGEHMIKCTLEALENSELTWEKGHVLNLGIDIGLFNRRLDVIFDYWRRNSFDLIASLKNSAIGGTLYKYANYADMESRGYDLAIGITPIRTKNWNWKSNLTLGYTTTKITNSKNMPSIYNMINARWEPRRISRGELVFYSV